MPTGMSRLHPGHRYTLLASYGCTRRTSTSPYRPSHIEVTWLTRKRPQHQGNNDHKRRTHNKKVAGSLDALAMRIESHALSIVFYMETLEVFRENGIVTVTMNRPAKKNAANGTMWDELRDTFKTVVLVARTLTHWPACATSPMWQCRLHAFLNQPLPRCVALP